MNRLSKIRRGNFSFSIPDNYPGLILNYNMTTSGTALIDNSPNALNGTLGGAPQGQTPRIGKTITFNGTSQYVDCGDNDLFSFPDINDVFTILYIAKRASSANGSPAGKHNVGADEYSIQCVSNQLYFFCVDNVAGGRIGRTTVANIWPINNDYYFIVFRKTAGSLSANCEIWLGGVGTPFAQVDVANFELGTYNQMANTNAVFFINYGGSGAAVYQACDQRYFAMFDVAVTNAELTAFYNQFVASGGYSNSWSGKMGIL